MLAALKPFAAARRRAGRPVKMSWNEELALPSATIIVVHTKKWTPRNKNSFRPDQTRSANCLWPVEHKTVGYRVFVLPSPRRWLFRLSPRLQVANGVCRLWWMEKAKVVSLLFGSNHFVKVRTDFIRVRFQDDSLSYGQCACHIYHGGIRPMSSSLLGSNKLLF